jgi:cytoskeletal protein CcmA (bactofilin family)
MAGNISQSVAVLLTLVCLLTGSVGVVAAQSDTPVSASVVVEEGETVDGIDSVTGSVVVRGTVDGSITGVVGSVTVAEGGRVTGDVESAAGSITVAGVVEGDVDAAAWRVTVRESGAVGSLDTVGRTVTVAGAVTGDARVGAKRLSLAPTATVDGSVTYDSPSFERSSEAVVAGSVTRDSSIVGPALAVFAGPDWASVVALLVASALVGGVLVGGLPGFSSEVSTHVREDPVRSTAVGVGLLVVSPFLLLLAGLTVVGLPVTVVGALAYGVVLVAGLVYGEYVLGSRLLGVAGVDHEWGALAVGVVIGSLAEAVPVLGNLLVLPLLLLGSGGIVLELRAIRRRRRTEASSGGEETTRTSS